MKKNITLLTLGILLLLVVACRSMVSIQEQALPQNVYLDKATFNAYVRNKDMIQRYAQQFGFDLNIFVNLIQSVQVSVLPNDSVVLTVRADALTVNKKRELMKLIKAERVSKDKTLWKYVDENAMSWFFDLGFTQALVISNFETQQILSMFTWEMPVKIQEIQNSEDTEAWMWNETEDFLIDLPFGGFTLHWFGVVVTDYQSKGGNATIDFMLHYSGNKSVKTTIKLFLPVLLSMFNLAVENRNSQVEFLSGVESNPLEETLLVKDIGVSLDTYDIFNVLER